MDFAEHRRQEEGPVNPAVLLDGLLRVSQIARLRLNDWLGHFDLNDGRHSVLAALAREDKIGCSQAELAVRLGQSESNISTLIERMQRDGLVNRLRSDADRRKRVVRITPAGRSALASVDARRSHWAGRLLSGVGAEDCSQLFALLQKLAASMEASATISSPALAIFPEPVEGTIATTEATLDPADDPDSPQFALRKMLLALSSPTVDESREKDAA